MVLGRAEGPARRSASAAPSVHRPTSLSSREKVSPDRARTGKRCASCPNGCRQGAMRLQDDGRDLGRAVSQGDRVDEGPGSGLGRRCSFGRGCGARSNYGPSQPPAAVGRPAAGVGRRWPARPRSPPWRSSGTGGATGWGTGGRPERRGCAGPRQRPDGRRGTWRSPDGERRGRSRMGTLESAPALGRPALIQLNGRHPTGGDGRDPSFPALRYCSGP